MDKLVKEKILENLPEKRLNISIFDEIDSTNDEAKRLTTSNEFNIIVAETQLKGRGRRGSKWSSPNSQNIYMTFCTENKISYAPASLVTGVICKKSINNINKEIEVSLKWPNDILYGNKKVGGILVEKEYYGKKIRTIIGIGINLNLKNKESWWGDLSKFDLKKQRNELINEIIRNLIKTFDDKNEEWKDEWRKSCMHMNKEIEVYDENNFVQKGIFKNIDDLGNAMIETNKGLEVFRSGQIKIKGIY